MKEKVVILIFSLLIVSNFLIAQKQLVFENSKLTETIQFEAKDYVKIQYSGYLNQIEESKTYIVDVTDSSLVFINTKGTSYINDKYEVLNSDITGFRKFWKYQPFVKPVAVASVSIGTYYLLDGTNNYSETEVLLYASLAGVATNYIIGFIFDEDIQFKIADGWKLRVGIIAAP